MTVPPKTMLEIIQASEIVAWRKYAKTLKTWLYVFMGVYMLQVFAVMKLLLTGACQ